MIWKASFLEARKTRCLQGEGMTIWPHSLGIVKVIPFQLLDGLQEWID